MRGNKIMAILWLLIAILCIYILIKNLNSKSNNEINIFFGGNSKLLETKTFSKEEINNFDFNLVSESLEITSSNDDKVYVELYCTEELKPNVMLNANTLQIESKRNNRNFSFTTFIRKIIVKLPDNIKLENANMHSSSGSFHINNFSCNKLNIQTSSGSIYLNDTKTEDTKVLASSGSIHIDNCNSTDLDLNTSSGSVHLNGSFDKAEIGTSSGSIHANFNKALLQDSSFSASSGSIHLKFPSDASFKSIYHVSSGNYKNSITGTNGKTGTEQVNNGGPEISFQTRSGSIRIN